jgi:hypothetical protein
MRWSRFMMRSNQTQIESAATGADEKASRNKALSRGVATFGKPHAQIHSAGSRRETIIESRLTKLGDRLAQRSDAPFFKLMHDAESTEAATDSIRDASERLAAEADALSWVLRIAKHSEGPVRARLWLDIDRALNALENLEMLVLRVPEESRSIPVEPANSVPHGPEARLGARIENASNPPAHPRGL